MHLLSVTLTVPLALGGETSTQDNTGLAIISIVSMVFGYLLLAGLWYFVFRDRKARAKRRKDERPSE